MPPGEVPWAALGLVTVVTGLLAHRRPDLVATPGAALARLLRRLPGSRWALLAGWAWLGWHLLARYTVR